MLALGLAACEGPPGPVDVSEDSTDVPNVGLTTDQMTQFMRGDFLIDTAYRDIDGLGPLYVEASCRTCHGADKRGPGNVERMSIRLADGTSSPDQSALPFGTVVRPHTAAGATHPLLPPVGVADLDTSIRFGPALFGRGRLEAIADQTILDEEARQAKDGVVSGRANHLPDGTIGRFGVKARISTLDTFVADAFHSDMGLTTSRFPTEFPNPDGLTDDLKPGIDIEDATVTDIAAYVRTLAIPKRVDLIERGTELLASTGCLACHVDTYQTRPDFSIGALAGIAADIYSDLLLHDLGIDDADAITDDTATGREWKTAPLVGLRFFKSFLHDGRAKSLDDAILMHDSDGSEATFAVDRYKALSNEDRAVLQAELQKL